MTVTPIHAPHDAPTPYGPQRLGPKLRAWLLAWVLASVWGSVVQTQWNLYALLALGVPIPMGDWLRITAQDLAGFAPVYGGILAVGWLLALPTASALARRWPTARTPLLTAAAGAGMVAAVRSVDAVVPMPFFIDATRHLPGLLTLAVGAVLAGWMGARWTATHFQNQTR